MKQGKGFSLIELVVVMMVLAFGLTSLIFILQYSAKFAATIHYNTVVNTLCQEKMENLLAERRANGFNGASLAVGTTTESPITGFDNYKRTTQINYVNLSDLNTVSGPATNYKRITVSTGGLNSSDAVSVSTVVSNY